MLISKHRTMAMVNQKGGVGKTTTTINLSAALAEKGVKVLVVDIDPQANSTSGLGLDSSQKRLTVYELLAEQASINEVITPTRVSGLFIIPANRELSGAEIELTTERGREGRLHHALGTLKEEFDFVLIDCPPSLGILTLNALTAAGQMLVPMQAEYFSLEGLSHLVHTQQLVRRKLNRELDLGGILMTQFDGRTTVAWEVLQEVRRAYPTQVFRSVIPRNIRLSEAPSHGLPVTLYDPTCRGSVAYRGLAEEILERSGWSETKKS